MINYQKHPEQPNTEKREHIKDLRNTIVANLARDASYTWTAFRLLQDIQLEVLDDYCDFEGLKAILEHSPQRKKEYQEMYDAVILSLSPGSSRESINFPMVYLVLQNIGLDLLYDCLKNCGENIVDQ